MFQILVVEDDASLRKLMSAALKQHGYVTFLANDGLEALDVLEKTNIDLIISDIMMPNMDGYELTRQLRKADFNLPILMVTAKETFEDIDFPASFFPYMTFIPGSKDMFLFCSFPN